METLVKQEGKQRKVRCKEVFLQKKILFEKERQRINKIKVKFYMGIRRVVGKRKSRKKSVNEEEK